MRRTSALLVGVTAAALSLAASAVTFADPGEPGEPQALVWVDGYTAFGGPQDQFLTGQGWEVGEEVDFYVNDVFVATSVAEPNAEGSATPGYLPAETVVAGDVVKLVGDTVTRVHTVTDLTVTRVNPGRDTVTGTAEPGAQVVLFVRPAGAFEFVTADQAGNWIADFSSAGEPGPGAIAPGSVGVAIELDNDGDPGDGTVVGWRPPGRAPSR